ncbi:type VI secretion system tip protein VgrG, partial [Malaciobacter molluscorum LMG 25693]
QKDVSDKFLQNLFVKIGKELRVDIEDGFHLNTNDLKVQASDNCLFDGANGISFKCGSNILTVDASGIHFNTPNFVDNSANGGVSVEDVIRDEDIMNVRLNDLNNNYLTKTIDKDVVLKADTTLSDGRNIKVSLIILDKEGKELARQTKNTTIKNKRISEYFDKEEIMKEHNLSYEDIYEIEGEVEW